MNTDRVPEDFPTIQVAVDEGRAPVIEVGPGRWRGAVLRRPVEIHGDGAVIASGVSIPGGQAGFTVPASADGAVLLGLTFDCGGPLDFGVYGSVRGLGSVADDVSVVGNVFLDCVQAVTDTGSDVADPCSVRVDGGRDWTVRDNHVQGLRGRTRSGFQGGGIGVVVHNASGVLIADNTFAGASGADGSVGAAVVTSGCVDCAVVGNAFAQERPAPGEQGVAVANVGASLPGAVRTANLAIVDNDASLDQGSEVPYFSVGSVDTLVEDNLGEAWVRDLPACR